LKLDEEMAEFCGVICGDGNIWTNGRKYEITITGNPKDKEYLDKIANYVSDNIKPTVYYRIRGRGLRLTVYSKELFRYLTEVIGFGIGTDKNLNGIPRSILKNRKLELPFIRGVFDTDGSFFISDKKGALGYPTIEITNENIELLVQIKDILREEGFRVTFRKSNKNTFKTAIHGKRMLELWLQRIGSSHPRKLANMESIIKTMD